MSDRRRVHLNPDLDPVVIPGRILNELCAHARETRPEECCGLVSGLESDPYRTVHRCRNDMTRHHDSDSVTYPRDGREAFYMNELDYLKAQQQAESTGEKVTAVYHSHVEAGAYFSEMDQEFANQELFPFPEAAHVVVALWEGRVAKVAIFRRDSAGGEFTGRLVEAGDT